MTDQLKWKGNFPKDHAEQYLKEHPRCFIGKCKDSGCYYGTSLDNMGLVGIYENECDHEWDISSPIDTLEVCMKCGMERPCEPVIKASGD